MNVFKKTAWPNMKCSHSTIQYRALIFFTNERMCVYDKKKLNYSLCGTKNNPLDVVNMLIIEYMN